MNAHWVLLLTLLAYMLLPALIAWVEDARIRRKRKRQDELLDALQEMQPKPFMPPRETP